MAPHKWSILECIPSSHAACKATALANHPPLPMGCSGDGLGTGWDGVGGAGGAGGVGGIGGVGKGGVCLAGCVLAGCC